MRTFTFRDGKSDKFWDIDLQGDRFTVTFGRRGTAGRTQTKQFADAEQARAAHDKLIQEKLAKGYVEKGATAAPASLLGALEAALVENPDDLAAHMAYADYLQEHGDPRGEFIQVQLALEDPGRSPKERKELEKREKALLEKHARDWLGEFLPTELLDQTEAEQMGWAPHRHDFSRGWLHALTLEYMSAHFAEILAQAPQARLLRKLTITGGQGYEPAGDFAPLLVRPSNLRNVRFLHLGEAVGTLEEAPGHPGDCHTSGEGAAELIRRMPRLEELYLFAHLGVGDVNTLFGLPTLGNLRVLQLYHLEAVYPLQTLAANPCLGRLTHLLIHPHGFSGGIPEGSYLPLSQVQALVRSPHLTSLTHLRLRLSNMGDDGCRAIVDSGILRRLRVLDLNHGSITEAGARVLAACPDLRHLERLDVGENFLNDAGVAALQATGVNVQAEGEYTGGGDGWLQDGDME